VPVLPKSPRHRAKSYDADPLRYLRGVLAFFLGGGTLIALLLALTGVAPRALLLAGLLWALFGILTGMVDFLLGPLAEFIGELFANITSAAPERADRVSEALRKADELAGQLDQPEAAARELETLRKGAGRLSPRDDIRIGLALAELYERQLKDPGRALGELRRLIDRHPEVRETVQLRGLLAALRAEHFAQSAP
jgi:flagellar biosynthesis protein FliQ